MALIEREQTPVERELDKDAVWLSIFKPSADLWLMLGLIDRVEYERRLTPAWRRNG